MIEHASYSSILLFLSHPAAWHSKYVLGIQDQKTNAAALTGIGLHKYLELLHQGAESSNAKEAAVMKMRTIPDVDFGKTGSIEKCEENLGKLIDGFLENRPTLGKILGIEAGYMQKIPGIKTPLKGYVDLIHEVENEIRVIDWKSCAAFDDELTPAHILQGSIYYWLLTKAHGRPPAQFDIYQCKASKNSDGSPQVRVLTLRYAEHPEYLKAMKALVQQALKQMMRKKQVYLLNPRDQYESDAEWKRYLAQFS